jgi:hypothetical protein
MVELVRVQIDAAAGRPGWSGDAAASGFRGEGAGVGVERPRGRLGVQQERRGGGGVGVERRGDGGVGLDLARRRQGGSGEAATGWIWRSGGGVDLASGGD